MMFLYIVLLHLVSLHQSFNLIMQNMNTIGPQTLKLKTIVEPMQTFINGKIFSISPITILKPPIKTLTMIYYPIN